MIAQLEKNDIEYMIQHASGNKINVFFGDKRCIDVLKTIGEKNLSNFTDEEDFMLGIMLGYDRLKQCERFIERKAKAGKVEVLVG